MSKQSKVFWCKSHDREATHTTKSGEHCCDPKLAGNLLPCRAISIEDFQQRVIEEQRELDEKLVNLDEFVNLSAKFHNLPYLEQKLLFEQRETMKAYSSILARRIALFEE